MLLYYVRNKDRGFTLIEMITVIIIVGVIAAIATPNFLGLLNRNRANSAVSEIEGAIREAQRLAIRNGRSCTINITSATRTVSSPNSGSDRCLLSNRVFDDNVTIDADETIIFSGKGNTTSAATIVVSTNNDTVQRCVFVSSGLGLIRTGDYDDGVADSNNGANCS